MGKKTDWIKYQIWGRGRSESTAEVQWLYVPDLDQASLEKEDVLDMIFSDGNDWARHAESASYNYWVHETPPDSVVLEMIKSAKGTVKYYRERIKRLTEQLRERGALARRRVVS